MKKIANILGVVAMAFFGTAGYGEGIDEGWIPLWPDGRMPSVEGCTVTNGYPAIKWFLPEKTTVKGAMLLIPGGGYNHWSYEAEGRSDYFNAKGMAVAVLRYRVPRPPKDVAPKHLPAWLDAQRAVRMVRKAAPEMGLDPDKTGVMGFSAGGHLALLCATSSLTPAYERIDELDDLPCSVAWAVPIYPAYVLSDGVNGPNGKTTRGNSLSSTINPEFAFDAATPPMCLLHGDADKYSPMGSVRVYHRLREMGIPAELHIFAKKGHVFFRDAKPGEPAFYWKDRVWEWLSGEL